MGKTKIGSRDPKAYKVGDVTYGASQKGAYNQGHAKTEEGRSGNRSGTRFLGGVKSRKEMVP